MRPMKAAELVLDFDLYPRNSIDSHNVNQLKDALATGATLPPVVIDKKSKRVADGFHRVKAYLGYYGDDAEIPVTEKEYADDAALFLDAMRYNAAHGAKLDSCDRTHCIIISERLKIDPESVAGALQVSVDKLASLKTDRMATAGALTIPLKRTIRFKAGKKLTPKQVEANERLSGMNQQFYANQLITLIEADLLDTEDSLLIERLIVLEGLLRQVLDRPKRKAS